jgi:uncharacterized protein YbaR (Trm112 family)/SAM-dependent methyltransferase
MDAELLGLLACPECRATGLELPSDDAIRCPSCSNSYPIVNGVPNLLPSHLSSTLGKKNEYTGKLMESMRLGENLQDTDDPDTDRFMWEHHLYNWGKRVMFSHAGAAEIFSSYAVEGARRLCDLIQGLYSDISGKRLLYVGSGNDIPVALPLDSAGAFLVNLDVVSDSMEDLMAAGARHCVCGDARQLPFRDQVFDVVFSKGSVHHSQPIDIPLKEMVRVAERGGYIIAAEPNRYACLPRFPMPAGLGHPTPYEHSISSREVRRILSREGVSDFDRRALTHAHPGTPATVARMWERTGRAAPRLFDRFAFEFIICGRKP